MEPLRHRFTDVQMGVFLRGPPKMVVFLVVSFQHHPKKGTLRHPHMHMQATHVASVAVWVVRVARDGGWECTSWTVCEEVGRGILLQMTMEPRKGADRFGDLKDRWLVGFHCLQADVEGGRFFLGFPVYLAGSSD